MKTATIILSLALSACATCERHPVMCSVGVAVLAGSIAATAAQHGSESFTTQPSVHFRGCSHGAC
jgi:hypothetical protein